MDDVYYTANGENKYCENGVVINKSRPKYNNLNTEGPSEAVLYIVCCM